LAASGVPPFGGAALEDLPYRERYSGCYTMA
jgi:hypothetical protein